MKNFFFFFILVLVAAACQQPSGIKTADYFAIQDSGMQKGNVKVIEIESLGRKFNIWTKRFGNNPKTKILLLNGGPGGTHEYFECLENFLQQEGIEFIY